MNEGRPGGRSALRTSIATGLPKQRMSDFPRTINRCAYGFGTNDNGAGRSSASATPPIQYSVAEVLDAPPRLASAVPVEALPSVPTMLMIVLAAVVPANVLVSAPRATPGLWSES
jgi:hypothetical protein